MTGIPVGSVGPPMMCAKCGMRLNSWEEWSDDGKLLKLSWHHTMIRPDDWEEHEPQPMVLYPNAPAPVGFCDFCSKPDPTWSFPASPFKIDTGHETDIEYGSMDNWDACDACHDDIKANNWEPVYKRFFEHKAIPKFARADLKKDAERLHRAFRLHRLGPPFRNR